MHHNLARDQFNEKYSLSRTARNSVNASISTLFDIKPFRFVKSNQQDFDLNNGGFALLFRNLGEGGHIHMDDVFI